MYRLSQWAGDFPMLWEPHGSFTPLFTSQPEELAFSKSVSLRLHISASCPVFLFTLLLFFFSFFFSCFSLVWTPAQAVQISRTAVLSWPSGSPCYDGHAGKISAYAGESSFSTPVMIDHVRMHEWRWWNESSCQHLPVPSASYALRVHPVSPLHNWSSPIWSCSTMLLTPPPFFFKPPSPFFGQTFWTVHWQILYKIAI